MRAPRREGLGARVCPRTTPVGRPPFWRNQMPTSRRSEALGQVCLRAVLWMMAVLTLTLQASTARAQTSDITAPQLQAFSFAPTSIDVSAGAQSVTVTLRMTDELSGVGFVQVEFRGPTGIVQRATAIRVSGTSMDGTWSGSVAFPQFSLAGAWVVSGVQPSDVAGNTAFINPTVLESRGFPTQLTVASLSDTQPPVLLRTAVSPTSIDVSAGD